MIVNGIPYLENRLDRSNPVKRKKVGGKNFLELLKKSLTEEDEDGKLMADKEEHHD